MSVPQKPTVFEAFRALPTPLGRPADGWTGLMTSTLDSLGEVSSDTALDIE